MLRNKQQGNPSRLFSQATATVTKVPARSLQIAPARIKTPPVEGPEILRFRESERLLHWAIAVPFMICWITALILVLYYNPDPLRPYRDLFSAIHRISGVCLIILPILVLFLGRNEYKVHFDNIKNAWLWSLSDMKWLALMGLAAINRKIRLPEQGKFNAAEKVNFMLVMVSCPVLILTGLMIWIQDLPWLAWLVHASFAFLVTPIMLGHIYMATINPDTRIGLRGMISGYVDRHWAKHHYALWYRKHFEKSTQGSEASSRTTQTPVHNVQIRRPAPAREPSQAPGLGLPIRFSPVNPKVTPSFVFQPKRSPAPPKSRL